MTRPWERQKTDTQSSFEAFKIYRDMGEERSLVKVGEKLGKSRQVIERWSRNNQWVDRVAAYDEYMDKLLLKEEEKARKKMARHHAAIATKFLDQITERLKNFEPEELTPLEMVKWFDIAVKVERLSRGESTENQQHSGAVTVQIIDDLDELEE